MRTPSALLLCAATLLPSALCHSNLICTGLDETAGKAACTKEKNRPYHPNYLEVGQIGYQHTELGPLCRPDTYSGGNFRSFLEAQLMRPLQVASRQRVARPYRRSKRAIPRA
jgi:hypothetical protein